MVHHIWLYFSFHSFASSDCFRWWGGDVPSTEWRLLIWIPAASFSFFTLSWTVHIIVWRRIILLFISSFFPSNNSSLWAFPLLNTSMRRSLTPHPTTLSSYGCCLYVPAYLCCQRATGCIICAFVLSLIPTRCVPRFFSIFISIVPSFDDVHLSYMETKPTGFSFVCQTDTTISTRSM